MILVAARIRAHEQQNSRVHEHLKVLTARLVHAPHRRGVDGILLHRLRRKVLEKLYLSEGGRHRDAARGNLGCLIRIDSASVFDIVNTGLDERIDDAMRKRVHSDPRPGLVHGADRVAQDRGIPQGHEVRVGSGAAIDPVADDLHPSV